MEAVIRKSLEKLPEFPKGNGITIVVYGYRPWNVMLRIAPGAIRSGAAKTIKSALGIVVDRLRSEFDIELPKG